MRSKRAARQRDSSIIPTADARGASAELVLQSGVHAFAHGADFVTFFLRGGEVGNLAGDCLGKFAPFVIAAQTVLLDHRSPIN